MTDFSPRVLSPVVFLAFGSVFFFFSFLSWSVVSRCLSGLWFRLLSTFCPGVLSSVVSRCHPCRPWHLSWSVVSRCFPLFPWSLVPFVVRMVASRCPSGLRSSSCPRRCPAHCPAHVFFLTCLLGVARRYFLNIFMETWILTLLLSLN